MKLQAARAGYRTKRKPSAPRTCKAARFAMTTMNDLLDRDATALSLPELLARSGKPVITGVPARPLRVLALDPGDTTGWCVFDGGELNRADQMPGTPLNIAKLIDAAKPDVVVIEEYRIYGWMTQQHAWSDVPTLRLVGAAELACAERGVALVKQSPKNVKPFCTDEKLKRWEIFQTRRKHANDAIRHAAFFLLFGQRPTAKRAAAVDLASFSGVAD